MSILDTFNFKTKGLRHINTIIPKFLYLVKLNGVPPIVSRHLFVQELIAKDKNECYMRRPCADLGFAAAGTTIGL